MRRASARIETQKLVIKNMNAHIVSLREKLDIMTVARRQSEAKVAELSIGLAAAAAIVKGLKKEAITSAKMGEDLRRKLQLYRDEVSRLAEALNLNAAEITRLKCIENTYAEVHSKVCAENTKLRETLEAAVGDRDTYQEMIAILRDDNAKLKNRENTHYEARFRNEVVKTQELSKKVWAQDGELVALRKEGDKLYVTHQAALQLLHQYQTGPSLEARVGKLEAMHEWTAGGHWDFHAKSKEDAGQ